MSFSDDKTQFFFGGGERAKPLS